MKKKRAGMAPDEAGRKIPENKCREEPAGGKTRQQTGKEGGRKLPLGLAILYEDRDIIAADKPPGLLTIASATEKNKTVHWVLSEYLRKKGEKRRAAVVHRLDRDTSGIVLFAKSEQVKRKLMDNWDTLVLERKYIALAEGEIPEAEGTVNEALGEDKSGRMVVMKDGAPSVTHWKCLKRGGGFSLLEIELETGRRNQIRAHLSWLGFPIAGDAKYHSRKNPLKRLALHAETLKLYHPATGKIMEFIVPAPASFGKALRGKTGSPGT